MKSEVIILEIEDKLIEFDVTYNYTPKQNSSFEMEYFPEEYELLSLKVEGSDVTPLIEFIGNKIIGKIIENAVMEFE
jgi:hypothetical protein